LYHCVVIGGGPAGLTAAYELAKLDRHSIVFEQDALVGGISRTVNYKGYRFDIGGHRFFTKVEMVEALWDEILHEEFLVRPRLSRIFYGGKFFDYPLKPMNALLGLGPIEAVRIGVSYLASMLFPYEDERTFDKWVSNRFGKRLFEIFFKTYTEKVWGMPCDEMSADWAAQRIKNLDLLTAVRNAFLGERGAGGEVVTTLIEQFRYPPHGPGQMWESCVKRLADKGVETITETRVESLRHENGRIVSALVNGPAGRREVEGEHFLSSMPVRTLLNCMDPAPPADILAAANSLRYRDFLTVGLIVDQEETFPDNWIYIHSPDVKLGRIQNFKNWSPHMVPDTSMTSLGLEYFVNEGDELWTSTDEELIELGKKECDLLGLAPADKVIDGTVIRVPKAYPIYDDNYQDALKEIRGWLDGLPNLHLVGRNGQHRYNNQDHSMVTAVYAARNIAAGATEYDVWDVNVEDDYHEEVKSGESISTSGDRAVPGRVSDQDLLELVREAFARYDAVALGASLGVVAGAGLFLATVALLVQGGPNMGANLSVLGSYLPGFGVSWMGAALGSVEMGVAGFGFGWLLAKLINGVVALEERNLMGQVESRALDLFEGDDG